MTRKIVVPLAAILSSCTLFAGTVGFVEQYFSDIHFERSKWDRDTRLPCFIYTALENGATVEVLRIGTNNLVPFRANKGLKVTVCGSVAAFDEGFETGVPTARPLGLDKPTP